MSQHDVQINGQSFSLQESLTWTMDGPLLASSPRRKSSGVSKAIAIWALSFTRLEANRNLLTAMSLLPKSIHRCRRYPTKFNSGRDIPRPVTGRASKVILLRQTQDAGPEVEVLIAC